MRAELLTYLTNNLTGSIKVSTELPFENSGVALYRKNMKRVYVDNADLEATQLQGVLNGNDIMQFEHTVQVYLAVDAKNRPSDLDSALSVILNARTQSGINDSFRNEFNYTVEIDGDVEVYTFTYTFATIA